MVYFRVEDMGAALDRVRGLGGIVEEAEDDEEKSARFGRFRLCRDDQGSPSGSTSRPRQRATEHRSTSSAGRR